MNFDFYLLGTPDGYNQYPMDKMVDLFRSFHDEVKADTQLTVYRNAELVYYVYTRNLRAAGKNQYFGMVIALNGVYLSHIGNVLSVFEQLCSNIALRGRILKIDKTGKIQFAHSRFLDTPEEIETVLHECRDLVEKHLWNYQKQLPEEYVVPIRAITITYNDDFNNHQLNNLLKEYNRIYFTDADNENEEYFDELIARLYEDNRNLKEQYRQLNSQKKQYRFVIILLIMLAVVGGTLVSVNHYVHLKHVEIREKNARIQDQSDSIQYQSTRIQDQSDTIQNQNTLIQDQSDTIGAQINRNKRLTNEKDRLAQSVSSLQLKIRQLRDSVKNQEDELGMKALELDGLRRNIGNTYPIMISSVQMGNFYYDGTKETDYGGTIFSSYSSYLEPRIKYRGLASGSVPIKMKLYQPNGKLWRDAKSPNDCSRKAYIESKMNRELNINTSDFRVGGAKGYWRRGIYRIEFWYNDRVCLYSGTFNVE